MDYLVSKSVKVLVNIEGSLRELPASLQFYSNYLLLVMADRDVRIPLSDIDTLQLQNNELRIRIHSPQGPQTFAMVFESKEEAKDLMSYLPLQKEAQESQDFMQNLDYSAKKTPVTTVIIALNILVFVLMYGGEKLNIINPQNLDVFIKWGSNRIFETIDQPWRLFTCAWLHFGILHIACNMYFLHAIGRLSEKLLGPVCYIIIYIFSAFMGSLASLLWNADGIISAGASGAVFGVVGMICAFLVMRRNEVPTTAFKSLKNSMMQIVVLNFLFGMSVPGIDNAAHFGGLLGGFIGAAIMSRSLDPKKRRAQFMPKVFLGLTCLPLICMGVWKSGLIHSKPIIVFEQLTQKIADNQDKEWINSDHLIQAYIDKVISEEEFKDEVNKEKEFWQEQLNAMTKIELDKESRFLNHYQNILARCQFQIDYRQELISRKRNKQELIFFYMQKKLEWKELIK
ncbi:rhomboid family intramembrane serine protease [Lentisphaera marina]|uniref:rhomboid family intramembrane serine protease n=1 Tax=Lentisphaera marina TaxID=1111041 RepID=UPI002365C05C|nr:rhomboid family intramembrane serine protease [Lentisphaera marina]MDD7983791.1 rhomboid family intramembrane serine protease [Lentisphaera marina]